jgi:predicted Ser/Thr protein kinase
MSDDTKCSQCGAPLSPGAPEGLCPACLLRRGLETQTAGGGLGADFTPPAPEELAQFFPRLEILELLGRGGMGVVYKARQPELDRLVALKILPGASDRDPAFTERFTREARSLARLSHPNIVSVYEFGQTSGLIYFVMEFVDGVNLRQLLEAGQMKPEEALAIVPQICEALQTAHDQGIVHRDIKPENLLIDTKGRVKIADFGIAKIVGAEERDMTLTGAGEMVGTPAYMAPEQIEHPREVDHRADIYSLGVVFYQMLTGELPLGKFAPPSRKVLIDVRLDEVVLRALEKEPDLRYQQASEVRTQVETIAGSAWQDPAAAHIQAPEAESLNRSRWRVVLCSLLVVVGALVIALNYHPIQAGMVAGTWGILFFLAACTMAFAAGESRGKVAAACQVTHIAGIGILAAGIKSALLSPELQGPWLLPIIAACSFGIFSGIFKLVKTWSEGSWESAGEDGVKAAAHSKLASVALFFAGLGGVLVWATFFCLWNTPAVLDFAALAMAGIGVGLAIHARAHWWAKLAVLVGIISIASVVWIVPWSAMREGIAGIHVPELLQDETLDIQPDGSAHFTITSSTVNREPGAPLLRDGFAMSSGFQVEKATDDHGLPVHFDVRRTQPNLDHYTVVLNNPVPYGGMVTVTIEGVVSGLIAQTSDPEVFDYDFDHTPGYDGVTHRTELHRLPPGAQLLEKSPDDLQVISAGDHIELRIDRRIPQGGSLDVRYRYRLNNGVVPAVSPEPSALWLLPKPAASA